MGTEFHEQSADEFRYSIRCPGGKLYGRFGHQVETYYYGDQAPYIETKLIPFFGKRKICDIDELCVRRWQNDLLDYRDDKGEAYSDTYLKTINNQLSAIMNYAMVYYKLTKNPCRAVGSIGKANADAMKIWTLNQFE